jgi:hypothetical protein
MGVGNPICHLMWFLSGDTTGKGGIHEIKMGDKSGIFTGFIPH